MQDDLDVERDVCRESIVVRRLELNHLNFAWGHVFWLQIGSKWSINDDVRFETVGVYFQLDWV